MSERVLKPVVSGVYFLFKDRALVYTGKSRDVYGRIDKHRVNGRQFDYAMVSACPAGDVDWVEAALIKAFSPPENIAMKPRHPPTLPVNRGASAPRQAAPPDQLPRDDAMVVTRPIAVAYARCFGRSPASITEAISTGALPATRSTKGKGAYQIRVGDLKRFCGATG